MTFSVRDILHMEVAPALGCTEPAAIAYGAAVAASVLPVRKIESIEIWVDPNIYKNGIAVSIPGTDGLRGLDTAAALGALGGDPALILEVLDPIDDEIVKHAKELLHTDKVKVNLLDDAKGLYIRTVVKCGSNWAESIIRDVHDNLISLTFNGDPVEGAVVTQQTQSGESDLARLENWLKSASLRTLLELTEDLQKEDYDFLQQSIFLNMSLAEHGLQHGPGLGIGKALDRLVKQRFIKRDMILVARMLTSAAADARMSGVKLPAMTSAGSGNHGLTAVLPIWAIKDFVECEERAVLKAVALSHLITAYVKAHTGRLSAVCGCSIAAGAGAAGGVAYLLGGDIHHVAGAIANLIEDLAGIICDGAKVGCALKLATAAGTAVQAALFALQGVNAHDAEGIIGASFEQTTRNIGALSTIGMIEADRTILRIMLQRKFSDF